MGIGFKADDHEVLLIGYDDSGHLGQSLWLREIIGREDGRPPPVDLEAERKAGEFVRELAVTGKLNAVHDISDGGLLVALSEMALASDIGANLSLNPSPNQTAAAFGENQGRYLVATDYHDPDEIVWLAEQRGLCASRVARTGGQDIRIASEVAGYLDIVIPLADLRAANERFFRKWMET